MCEAVKGQGYVMLCNVKTDTSDSSGWIGSVSELDNCDVLTLTGMINHLLACPLTLVFLLYDVLHNSALKGFVCCYFHLNRHAGSNSGKIRRGIAFNHQTHIISRTGGDNLISVSWTQIWPFAALCNLRASWLRLCLRAIQRHLHHDWFQGFGLRNFGDERVSVSQKLDWATAGRFGVPGQYHFEAHDGRDDCQSCGNCRCSSSWVAISPSGGCRVSCPVEFNPGVFSWGRQWAVSAVCFGVHSVQ